MCNPESVRESKGKVLVHCHAGISRSSTICMAYLMAVKKYRMEEAYEYVKSRRRCVSPNFNFMEQLLNFENHVFSTPTTSSNNTDVSSSTTSSSAKVDTPMVSSPTPPPSEASSTPTSLVLEEEMSGSSSSMSTCSTRKTPLSRYHRRSRHPSTGSNKVRRKPQTGEQRNLPSHVDGSDDIHADEVMDDEDFDDEEEEEQTLRENPHHQQRRPCRHDI